MPILSPIRNMSSSVLTLFSGASPNSKIRSKRIYCAFNCHTLGKRLNRRKRRYDHRSDPTDYARNVNIGSPVGIRAINRILEPSESPPISRHSTAAFRTALVSYQPATEPYLTHPAPLSLDQTSYLLYYRAIVLYYRTQVIQAKACFAKSAIKLLSSSII